MKWISVEDQLPHDGDYVLVYYFNDIEIYRFWTTSDKRRKIQDWGFEDPSGFCFESQKITHWMPLPEIPK